jgi:hypothetical protein
MFEVEYHQQRLAAAGYGVAAYIALVQMGLHPVQAATTVVDEADALLHADLLAAGADPATAAAIVIGDTEVAPLAGGAPQAPAGAAGPQVALAGPSVGDAYTSPSASQNAD